MLRRAMAAFGLGTLVILASACAGQTPMASPSPTAAGPSMGMSPTSTPTVSAAVADPALFGEWSAQHECEHIVELLTAGGFASEIPETITGNGMVPGLTFRDPLPNPDDPCEGTVARDHFHEFAADGTFASFDWEHRQVDDGVWRAVDRDTIRVNHILLDYRVAGAELILDPQQGSGSYGVMVALPGKTWNRVESGS